MLIDSTISLTVRIITFHFLVEGLHGLGQGIKLSFYVDKHCGKLIHRVVWDSLDSLTKYGLPYGLACTKEAIIEGEKTTLN